jgi:pyruvate,water dikinase
MEGEGMSTYTLGIHEIDRTKLSLVGGKGANLGELSRIAGVRVPDGFCVTTEAYADAIGKDEGFCSLLDQLSQLQAGDKDRIRDVSARIREVVEGMGIPTGIADEISRHLERLGAEDAYAVRSSATAEDLPTASFAGQHDTYLNIVGRDAVLRHVSKCWASLFHRPCSDLSDPERLRSPQGPAGGRGAADGLLAGCGDHVHR